MKLERLPEYVTIVVTIVLGVFTALYLGLSAGVGSGSTYKIIGGIVAVMVALSMRTKVWLLIPLFWPLMGQIVGLPGAIPVRDFAILYAFGVFLALKALKIVRVKNQYDWLDYFLFANLAYLAAIYIKNPVGTDSMGFERIGGKPYFEILSLSLGYWVIGHVTISAKLAHKLPLLMILGDLFTGALGFITFRIPAFGQLIGSFYTGIAGPSADSQGVGSGISDEREIYLADVGTKVPQAYYSYYSVFPFCSRLTFGRFLFFCLTCLAMYGVLKSGFRTSLFSLVLFLVFSAYFRHGFWSVARMSIVLVPLLALILAAQGTLVELPIPMQRTMSFLPAKWSPEAVEDSTGSTEWRLKIWKNVWTSGDKYIKDWWFGDGFGMTKTQLVEAANSTDSAENLTIAGVYHSLPLSAIHTVGYIGFSLFCSLFFGLGVYAWKVIRLAKGTPFFALALFVGVPAVVNPVPALVLTGFFDGALLGCIFSVAMLRLIARSLEQYRHEQNEAEPVSESETALPELAFHRFKSDLP